MVPHWPGEAALCLLKQEGCPAAAFPELLIGFFFVTLRLLVLIKAFGLCKSAIWSTVASPRFFFLESKFFSPTLLKLHCPCFSGCLTSYPFHVAHRRLIQSPLKAITGFMLLIADFGSEINSFFIPLGFTVYTPQLSFCIPWYIIKDKLE